MDAYKTAQQRINQLVGVRPTTGKNTFKTNKIMTTLGELVEALEKKGINYEFVDMKRWAGFFDENEFKVMEAIGSHQISFEYEEYVWAHFKILPLSDTEGVEVDLTKEPIFFVARYNGKIGKSIRSCRAGKKILDKILN